MNAVQASLAKRREGPCGPWMVWAECAPEVLAAKQ